MLCWKHSDMDPAPRGRQMESNSRLVVIQTGFNYSRGSHRSPVGLHYHTCPWSAFILLQHCKDKVDYIL